MRISLHGKAELCQVSWTSSDANHDSKLQSTTFDQKLLQIAQSCHKCCLYQQLGALLA
jgi:hypothetical protein